MDKDAALPAVTIKDVVKQYRVRHEKGRTLKELFLRQRIFEEKINALDHVSFDVTPGQTLGIIGANGSGKSTMLKLIAGTSRPTSGSVEVNGRVSALLELGAGFHPDFTGRENIYLDGAIMGLSREVVDERFDEIVAFAGMEEFVDAPAKTYSSGMFLRLAFSVAVNVDPDIILIDEVFAVGDESFQRKCLDRMDRFKGEGKTIMFVSHSLDSIRSFCDEALWLDKGEIKAQGAVDKVIDYYLWHVNEQEEERLSSFKGEDRDENRWGTGRAEITEVRLCGADGEQKHIFETGDKFRIRIAYSDREHAEDPVIGMSIHRHDGVHIFGVNTLEEGPAPAFLKGEGEVWFEVDRLPLLPGSYQVSVSLHNGDASENYDYHNRRFEFRVVEGPDVEVGLMHLDHQWSGWQPGEEKLDKEDIGAGGKGTGRLEAGEAGEAGDEA